MKLLLDKLFASVAWGHFAVDLLNGTRGVLITFLSVPLGLSNSAIGLFSTIYTFAASLTQPLFGYVADRLGSRWVVAGGVLWIGIFFSLAMVVPLSLALVFLLIAAIGSAAFHPAGASEATTAGQNRLQGRESTAASFFFFFGQTGYFLGPMVGGVLLALFDRPGLLLLSVITIPVALFAGSALRDGVKPQSKTEAEAVPVDTGRKVELLPLVALILIAAFQAWSQQNVTTFLPKYLSDLGQSVSTYGVIAALYMAGSAFGNLLGGNLADRIGKYRVIMGGMGLSFLPLMLISAAGTSGWLYLIVPLAGITNGAAYPVTVVLAQKIIPSGRGLATGLVLGGMFSFGAIGAWWCGILADTFGIPVVFLVSAIIGLIAAGLAFLMDEKRSRGIDLPVSAK